MALEVTGRLIEKHDAQQVTERFKKREFVLDISEEVNGNVYANYAKMQLVQNRCEILDRFNEGDVIKVSFNIRGNRWERDGKINYINSLDAWRIEHAGTATGGNQPQGYTQQNNMQQSNQQYAQTNPGYMPSSQGATADDLPF